MINYDIDSYTRAKVIEHVIDEVDGRYDEDEDEEQGLAGFMKYEAIPAGGVYSAIYGGSLLSYNDDIAEELDKWGIDYDEDNPLEAYASIISQVLEG